MVVNRYTQLSPSEYDPFSLQELAFAPSILRNRHDETIEQIAKEQAAKEQYSTLDEYAKDASLMIDPISQGLDNLSKDLSTKGIIDSDGVNRVMEIKAKRDQLFGPSGGIGKLQEATKEYQNRIQSIKDMEDMPEELKAAAISRSKPGESIYDPATNKLTIKDHNIQNLVTHIPEQQIKDDIIKNISKLKASDLGITKDNHLLLMQKMETSNDYVDVLNFLTRSGVSKKTIRQLVGNYITPSMQQSIMQEGELLYNKPKEEYYNSFLSRLQGMGDAYAYQNTDQSQKLMKDDVRISEAIKKQNNPKPTIVPGSKRSVFLDYNIENFTKSNITPEISKQANFIALQQVFPVSKGYTVEKDSKNNVVVKKGDKIIDSRKWGDRGGLKNSKGVRYIDIKSSIEKGLVKKQLISNNKNLQKLANIHGQDKAFKMFENFGEDLSKNYTDGVTTTGKNNNTTGVNDALKSFYIGYYDDFKMVDFNGEPMKIESDSDYIDETFQIDRITNTFGHGVMGSFKYKKTENDEWIKGYIELPDKMNEQMGITLEVDDMITNKEGFRVLSKPMYEGHTSVSIPNYETKKINIIHIPNDDFENEELVNLVGLTKKELNEKNYAVEDFKNIQNKEMKSAFDHFVNN